MVEIIAGEKGKGKTKYLLDKVNESVKSASGNIVYLDKMQLVNVLLWQNCVQIFV